MQAMADAVENSEFIMMCMSDSYKRSVYCQAEAEYAFRCKRHLLPVIVRQGYRADGWLGLIIGSRIYVDFGRLEFQNGCELLLKEITLHRENPLGVGKKRGTSTRHVSVEDLESLPSTMMERIEASNLPVEYIDRDVHQSTYRSTLMEQWTRKDVLDFLYDSHLHYMMPVCELMTGHGLIKLWRLCQREPCRFYGQLHAELASRFPGLYLSIGIFTQFLSEMDQLSGSPHIQAIEQDATPSKSVSPSRSSTSSPLVVVVQPETSKSSAGSSVVRLNSDLSSQQTTIQTLCNVQITEQTAYRTESIVIPSMSYTVQSTHDSATLTIQSP